MNNAVCAVLITYNRCEILKKALACIQAQTLPLETIIIVDNNSTDNTREFLHTIDNRENIKCLYLDNNIGSAGGIALGMQMGLSLKPHDYFWILDDDTFYRPEALQELVSNMQAADFAMIGLTGSNIRFGTKKPVTGGEKLQKVDYALIDGSLIKADVIREIGPVNEEFFMMCDDHEYCMRIKKHGYKVGLLNIGPIERLFLGGEGSFTKATLWRGYYSSRNMMLIIKKYFTLPDLLGYLFRQSKIIVAAALFAPDRFRRVRFRLMGIWHGIRGVGGKTLDPSTLKFTRN